jgi:hypothetical protein
MVVDLTTAPSVHVGAPKLLFKLSGPQVTSSPEGISHDGQRFVFGMPVSPSAR